jgi:flagellar biogenesis protein FliO
MKLTRAILLALAASPMAWAAQAETLTAPPSVGFSVLRVIGALCIVFSVLFGGLWAWRNGTRFMPNRAAVARLKVLESRSLGNRHSICVVAYDQQRILLSTSPTGVTMLTHLPEGAPEPVDEAVAPATPAPALPNFSSAFFQALATLRK